MGTAIAANPSAALLPIQGVYYMGMLGSTPARMFMSGGGGGAAGGISGDALNGMKDSLLANVGKLVDDKGATVLSGVTGQLGKWGAGIQSGIQAQMANAMHAGGLSVPHGWHTGAEGGMDRAAPLLPTNSVAAPSMSHRSSHQSVLAGADGRTRRTRYDRHGFESRRQGDATIACRRITFFTT